MPAANFEENIASPRKSSKVIITGESLPYYFCPRSIRMGSDTPSRLLSLDIFRGMTIAAMIIVNNLMAWTDTPRFPRLTHAQWNGCTLVDLIFPFFIFIVGVTSVFSLNKRLRMGESPRRLYRHILFRSGALFFLGLVACSYFICGWLLQAICPPAVTQKGIWAIFLSPPAHSKVFYFSLANLRIMGVLQRIALVYLAVSLLVIHTGWRTQAVAAGALLLIYWGLMTMVPGFALAPGKDLGAFLDRAVFGEAHLWRYAQTWDPEGLLSTLPAIATGLLGALTGHWLRRQGDRRDILIGLFMFGFFGVVVGTTWGYVFPINKYLWTSSFAVYTAGYALMFLAVWYWLCDVKQARAAWTMPFVWLGMNPLLAYCGAQIGSLALGVLYLGTPTQHTHLITIILNHMFGENWEVVGWSWQHPRWPSLYWALIYLTFWTLLMGLLYRKRIFLKI
jgi:predicted acyltransferase